MTGLARALLAAATLAAICVGLTLLVAAGAQSGVTTLTGPAQSEPTIGATP